VGKISIEPFLRWLADDLEQGDFQDGFRLIEAPAIVVGFEAMAPQTKSETPKKEPVVPKKEDRCTVNEAPMNLPDVVQTAIRTKLQTELKPVVEKLARLRALLDAYEASFKGDAERRISNAIMAALGEPQVPADPGFEQTKRDLYEAFADFALHRIELPLPPPQRTEPVPDQAPASSPQTPPVAQEPVPVAPATPPPPVSSPAVVTQPVVAKPPPSSFASMMEAAPPPRPPRKLRGEDVEAAKKLIAEIEALRIDVKNQHPVRLFPLLQAVVAEVRELLDNLPEDNFLHERLQQLIPVLGALKNEGKVEEYIRGLAFGSQGDWRRLSYKNRQKVEQFDRDVAASEWHPTAKSSKAKKTSGEEAPDSNGTHQWPSLPHLRKLTKPVLLAGGMIIPEKIKNVHERFGITVEWHEIDHDNPRASGVLLQRIRGGKIGALVLLEGFMKHSTFKPVVEACNNMKVPFAMGDKAGIASLQSAFAELDRKLS
jgi:hypothetical protein